MRKLRSVGFVAPASAWLFGQHARRGSRRVAVSMLTLATLLLLGAAAHWIDLRNQRSAQHEAQAAAERATRRSAAARPAAASAPALSAAERVRVNRIVRRLNTPWSSIFASLESQASPRVAVLSLEPDVERGAVRVHTEGPSLDELLRHAAGAQNAPHFAHTQLLRIDPQPSTGVSEMSRLSFDLVLAR